MKKNTGFSLIELQVGLVVATILILILGGLSGISHGSYKKLKEEAETFNNMTYALKFIQNRARSAKNISVQAETGQWRSERLIMDNSHNPGLGIEAFGIYKSPSNAKREIVYLADASDESNREILFSLEDTNDSDQNLEMTLSVNTEYIVVNVESRDGEVPFNLTNTIMKRLQ